MTTNKSISSQASELNNSQPALNSSITSTNGFTEEVINQQNSAPSSQTPPNKGIQNQLPPTVPSSRKSSGGFWQKLTLRTKATALAISLSVLPVAVIGGFGYLLARQTTNAQVLAAQQAAATSLAAFGEEFMNARFDDLRTLSQLSVFTDPKVREVVTPAEQNALLREFVESSPIYEDVAVVDLNGNPVAVSDPEGIPGNVSQNDWFQEILATRERTWVQPRAPRAGGLTFALIGAAPIFDNETGEMIYIVRTRLAVADLEQRIDNQVKESAEVALIDANQKVFVSNNPEALDEGLLTSLPGLIPWLEQREAQISLLGNDSLTAYAPILDRPNAPQLNWGVALSTDPDVAFAASRQLLITVLVGTGITTVLVAALAAFMANRAIKPIIDTSEVVTKLGQGDLNSRVAVEGEDEIGQLGSNINIMANRLQTLLFENEEAAKQQVAAQAQAESAEEEKRRSEELQRELMQLLEEMEEASKGDLTVRANLTAGEVGIIADVFNTIVESLRKIIVQVKQATTQVNTSIGENQGAIQKLADEALAQVDEVTNTLNSVEQMSLSIQEVAENARQAAEVARSASSTAQESGAAMERTVESILNMRSTVAETAKKVKQLGESSQQISQVIALINEIALKTNLLAVNAGIEAAHAGEQGKGFAVVAEQVGELAEQSAAATKEIEQIVKNIQTGTKEVVEAMELGTTQVVEGTNLVQETKQSLGRILEVSAEIDKLLQSISHATVSQAETSQQITNLMKLIAQASQGTSNSSRQVDGALRETVEVALQLQVAVGQFKVGD